MCACRSGSSTGPCGARWYMSCLSGTTFARTLECRIWSGARYTWCITRVTGRNRSLSTSCVLPLDAMFMSTTASLTSGQSLPTCHISLANVVLSGSFVSSFHASFPCLLLHQGVIWHSRIVIPNGECFHCIIFTITVIHVPYCCTRTRTRRTVCTVR